MIFGRSSYSELKLKKKKKIVELEFLENIQVELEFHNFFFFLVSFRYNLIVQKSSFTFETRFSKNRVSKQGHIPK